MARGPGRHCNDWCVTGLNPVSAGGFAHASGHYARARPAYAREAVGSLVEVIPPGAVLDVGAGTGILTGQLRRAGRQTVAVEPLAEMLDHFARALPRVAAVGALGESLPFRGSVFSGLTIAQAFHWMDHLGVLAEARRVLQPGGVLALVWNVRDESVPWVAELTDLIEARSGGRPYSERSGPAWEQVVGESGSFTHVSTERYANPVASSSELVVQRVRSTSFVALMDPAARESLIDEVRGVLARSDQVADREQFDYPHHTVVHLWRVTDVAAKEVRR